MRINASFFIFLITFPFFAQEIGQSKDYFLEARIRHVSQPMGLSSSKITDILKDTKGYIWFGSDNGLNRYDGRTITVFKNDENRAGTIGNDRINCIFQDQHDQLWIGTNKGLYIFDYRLETFIRQKVEGKSDYPIFSICEDKEGVLWFSTQRNLLNYDFRKKEFKKVPLFGQSQNETLELASTAVLKVDMQGELWIGTWGRGIFRMNPLTGEFRKFRIPTNRAMDILKTGRITCIEEGPDGSLWFGGWGYGLLRLFPDRKQTKFYEHRSSQNSLNGNKIKTIKFDNKGFLWIGIEEVGLDRFTLENENFTHFYNSAQFTDISEGPGVSTIMIDDQSLMWLGFRNHGIEIVPLDGAYFQHYKTKSETNHSVHSLYETDNGILMGTRGTLDFFDLTKNAFVSSYPLPNQETPIALQGYGKNKAFIGTYNGSLFKVDLKTGRFVQLGNAKLRSELISTKIKTIHRLFNEKLLIGTSKGVYLIDVDTGAYERFLENDVHTIQSGNDESIWLFSHGGEIFNYYPQTKKMISYAARLEGVLKSAYIATDDTIYMGTDLGFYHIDLDAGEISKYDNIFPYVNNQVNQIVKDNNAKYWFSSERGIVHFDPRKEKFRTYGKEDGLPKIRFNDGVGIRLKNGQLAFGGDDGFVVFDPAKIEDRQNAANLVFTKMSVVGNRSNKTGDHYSKLANISERTAVTLKHWQNNVTFNFALLSHTDPSKHRYQYELAGFNSGWFDLRNQNSVTFTNLGSGDYTLKIRSANEDNNWGPVTALKIHVTTAWYYTWYAYLVYFLLFLALMTYIIQFFRNREQLKGRIKEERLKLDQIEEKARQEHEFTRLRLNFFTNISHELRTPLSLILGPLDSFVKRNKKPGEQHLKLMYKNADRLKRLITQLLDFRAMESENLSFQPSWGNIVQFTQETANLFFPMAYQKDLKFVVNKNTDAFYASFDHDKLEKIIYNLLSNAFKYTEKGCVTVDINNLDESNLPESHNWANSPYDRYFELVFSDSGTGIASEMIERIFHRFYHLNSNSTSPREGTGIGLALTKALVEVHDGEIYTTSTLSKGSRFRVILPLSTQSPSIQVTGNEIEFQTAIGKEEDVSLQIESCEKHNFEQEGQEQATVLLVEDNHDLREYIRLDLGRQYHIIEAANGEEGLEMALETIPDLIISDISMPKMDGFEFCAAIRQNSATSHIPVIILTVHNSHMTKSRGYKIGADDYIEKPFSSFLLALRIENLLTLRKSLQEKFGKEVRLDPKSLPISSMDEVFLKKAMESVERNLGNPDFSANSFADEMCMSRVHLYRKLKALTDQSVSDFVRTIRLKLAANLIGENKLTIKEAAYAVGFNNPKYFSKCFKQQFGVNPSDYEIDKDTTDCPKEEVL